jgi:hypothetical protein
MDRIIPVLFFVVWLGLIVYVIVLATRFVNAVEQIARSFTRQQPPDVSRPE